jgi:hypothetical protein
VPRSVIPDLGKKIKPFDDHPIEVRVGTVVSVQASTVTVNLSSSIDVPDVKYLGSYKPNVGDVVHMIRNKEDLIIIGKLSDGVSRPLHGIKRATATQALDFAGATEIDVPGCTVTLTSVNPDAKVMVIAFFDFFFTANGNGTAARGRLRVDGTVRVGEAIFAPMAGNTDRATVGQTWEITIPTPKAFVVKTSVQPAAVAVSAASALIDHTSFSYILWD